MRKGKWIKNKDDKLKWLGLVSYRCSRCKNVVDFKEDSPFESISDHKYCYNCGAKMEVEK